MKLKRLLTIIIILSASIIAYAQTKVYEGRSSYTSDVVCNVKDGKIYKGQSSYTSDILATVRNQNVYSKTSSYSSDILFHYDGLLSKEEFVAVLLATKYVW